MKKSPKTKGLYLKVSPIEHDRLNLITEDLNLSNSEFLRICIDIFWISRQVSKGTENGSFEYNGDIYNLDLSQIAVIQQEMSQILTQERWEDIISKQAEKSLKRIKKPISMAS